MYHGVYSVSLCIGFIHLLCHVLIYTAIIHSMNESTSHFNSFSLTFLPDSYLSKHVSSPLFPCLQIIPYAVIFFPVSIHILLLCFHFSLISWCAQVYLCCLVLSYVMHEWMHFIHFYSLEKIVINLFNEICMTTSLLLSELCICFVFK